MSLLSLMPSVPPCLLMALPCSRVLMRALFASGCVCKFMCPHVPQPRPDLFPSLVLTSGTRPPSPVAHQAPSPQPIYMATYVYPCAHCRLSATGILPCVPLPLTLFLCSLTPFLCPLTLFLCPLTLFLCSLTLFLCSLTLLLCFLTLHRLPTRSWSRCRSCTV